MAPTSKRTSSASKRTALALLLVCGCALACATAPATAGEEDLALAPQVMLKGPDPGVSFEGIGGVAIEPTSGEFAVAEGDRGRVLYFGPDGWLLGRTVHSVTLPDGQVKPGVPWAIAYDRQGNLLVTDRLVPYVDVLDIQGSLVTRIHLPAPDDEFAMGRGAVALAVGQDGRIYIATQGDSARVHVYSADYDYLYSWGSAGTGPGQFTGITGIAVTPDGHVVVACARTEQVVQVFETTGKFIKGFGIHEAGQGNFSLPGGVAVTSDGRIWVADEMRQFVQVFTAGGEYVGFTGGVGIAAGEFQYPSALATDGSNRLVVAERLGGRVQVMGLR